MTDDLETPIGTKERKKLTALTVIIKDVITEEVTPKDPKKQVGPKPKKVTCHVQHPESETAVKMSEIKYVKKDKLVEGTLWINKDEDGNLQKDSPLALWMAKLGAKTLKELENKSAETVVNAEGYLSFKAY